MNAPIRKKPVAIRFYDHAAHVDKASTMKPMICEVVGYLVHQDRLHYRIVAWVTEDNLEDENCEGYAILKSTVVSIRRLR